MTNVFFVNDTSSGMNWGSQATSRAFRRLLVDAGATITHTAYKVNLRRYKPREEVPTTAWTEAIREIITSGMRLDVKGVYRATQEVDDAIPQKYSQFDEFARAAVTGGILQKEVEAIKSCDVVVINGEGLVYSSSDRCTRAIFFLAYLSKRYFETECVMANLTLDIQDQVLSEMAENVLPLLDDVVFREPRSAGIYDRYRRRSKSGADPVFSYHVEREDGYLDQAIQAGRLDVRPYSTATFDPTQPYICVAGSSIFQTRDEYNIEGYLKLCEGLKEICPQVLLIVSARSDEQLLSPVAENLDLNIIGLNISCRDAVSVLMNASVYIGGRYHPTIFALKGGVPIIPFSANTHKIEGLFDMFDIDAQVVNPFTLSDSVEQVVRLTQEYLLDASDFDHVPSILDDVSDRSSVNVQYIKR